MFPIRLPALDSIMTTGAPFRASLPTWSYYAQLLWNDRCGHFLRLHCRPHSLPVTFHRQPFWLQMFIFKTVPYFYILFGVATGRWATQWGHDMKGWSTKDG